MSLSASVTRILTLSGFPSELKTRDIQAAFSDWETERGGFKIKWVDDTTLMLVFTDANTAKRAYLSALLTPPPQLNPLTSDKRTVIKPYDGPDAQVIIANVNARTNNNRNGHNVRQSMSGINATGSHKRGQSYSNNSLGRAGGLNLNLANGLGTISGREPSPTLPSLPSHPTLNSLISSSLSPEMSPEPEQSAELDSSASSTPAQAASPPKVGDAGRRMVGHALGIRHPNVPRSDVVREIEAKMAGLAVTAE